MKRIFFMLICIAAANLLPAQKEFEIRYLGNMGIAILHNDSAIIIDGLHDYYDKYYLPADTVAIEAMIRRQKPFSNIIAIAVTHRHSDHFDQNVVASVAKVHRTALIISGGQTRALLNPEMQKRFHLVTETATITVGPNLLINATRIPHTYPERHSAVENYRMEIIWNGFRIVHLGDADTKSEAVAALNLNPDLLVVPSWFFAKEGIPLIEQIKPSRVIATHIEPGDQSIKKNDMLGAEQIMFKKYGDKINISKK